MTDHLSPPGSSGSPLYPLDAQLAGLRARFPHMRIWYVPRAATRAATWHAQPARYPLDAASPEELAALIEADQGGAR
jgi:hypothetical protein